MTKRKKRSGHARLNHGYIYLHCHCVSVESVTVVTSVLISSVSSRSGVTKNL